MDEGMTYIKLYRKVAENELFLEIPYDRWHAFEYLLLHARRFPSVVVLKGKPIPLDTGQLIIGEGKLGSKWGWSRGKVIRFLDMLEELEMIKKNGTPYGTVITVENYMKYQCDVPADDTSTSTSVGTPDGTSDGTHKKNDKKVKKVKKDNNNIFIPPSIDEVREYCIERGNTVDPEVFVNHYQSVGWKVGSNKMKDWKAAVRTWERRNNGKTGPVKVSKFSGIGTTL